MEEIEKTETNAIEPITMNSLVSQAIGQGANHETLQGIMDFVERAEANVAKKEYVMAMSGFRSECPTIVKTEEVDYSTAKGQTNYKHANLAKALEQIHTILGKWELVPTWKTDNKDNQIVVTCCVTHSLGHCESTSLAAPADQSGGKNAIQAIGSTVSYLQRYTLFSILGLATREMDNDGQLPPKYISETDIGIVNDWLKHTNSDTKKFCKIIGVESIALIEQKNLKAAIDLLDDKAKKIAAVTK